MCSRFSVQGLYKSGIGSYFNPGYICVVSLSVRVLGFLYRGWWDVCAAKIHGSVCLPLCLLSVSPSFSVSASLSLSLRLSLTASLSHSPSV